MTPTFEKQETQSRANIPKLPGLWVINQHHFLWCYSQRDLQSHPSLGPAGGILVVTGCEACTDWMPGLSFELEPPPFTLISHLCQFRCLVACLFKVTSEMLEISVPIRNHYGSSHQHPWGRGTLSKEPERPTKASRGDVENFRWRLLFASVGEASFSSRKSLLRSLRTGPENKKLLISQA